MLNLVLTSQSFLANPCLIQVPVFANIILQGIHVSAVLEAIMVMRSSETRMIVKNVIARKMVHVFFLMMEIRFVRSVQKDIPAKSKIYTK